MHNYAYAYRVIYIYGQHLSRYPPPGLCQASGLLQKNRKTRKIEKQKNRRQWPAGSQPRGLLQKNRKSRKIEKQKTRKQWSAGSQPRGLLQKKQKNQKNRKIEKTGSSGRLGHSLRYISPIYSASVAAGNILPTYIYIYIYIYIPYIFSLYCHREYIPYIYI